MDLISFHSFLVDLIQFELAKNGNESVMDHQVCLADDRYSLIRYAIVIIQLMLQNCRCHMRDLSRSRLEQCREKRKMVYVTIMRVISSIVLPSTIHD